VLSVILILTLGGQQARTVELLVPSIEQNWWRICETPDLQALNGADLKKQQVVDHGFIRAANGKWQLWGCIRGAAIGRLLYGWEGDDLEQGPWKPIGITARAKAEFGESYKADVTPAVESIQAPYFLQEGKSYLCFYNSAGVRLMTSSDGVHYERRAEADGGSQLSGVNGRDVMVFKQDGVYYAYSTISTLDKRGYVSLSTSRDLRTWTKGKNVCEGGRGGVGPVSAESPFVVTRGGYYFLFRASSNDGKTYVYRSDVLDDFGINNDSKLVAEFKLKAPEIIVDGDKEYISDLADFRGVKLARLTWVPAK
jgi:hypothetical protein